MKLMVCGVALAMGVALLHVGNAYATKTEVIIKADNKADFSAAVPVLQKNMGPGGRYGSITPQERETVNKGLADMQSLLDKYETVALMPAPAKLQMFNDQEAVNAALTKRDNDRLICSSEVPIGSHIPRTTCRTYRQIQIERGEDEHYLYRAGQVPQVKGNGG